jgi:hypothetical protein
MEWGVINNGGHLNIFNTDELLGGNKNSSNQLIGDTYTAKGDYAALYTLMRQPRLGRPVQPSRNAAASSW